MSDLKTKHADTQSADLGTEMGEEGMAKLKSVMNRDKDAPWQTSERGLAEGETLRGSKVFRKNRDK